MMGLAMMDMNECGAGKVGFGLRSFLLFFVFGLFLLFSLASARAGVYNVENIPVPRNGVYPMYTTNPDGILSEGCVSSIERRLRMMEDSLGVKVLVVAVERIEGDDPHQFSLGIFNKYGIGDAKTNRGLVLTLATLDRSYRITTGYGMEGDLPDAICSRIGTRTMLPRLKEGDWDGAVYSAVDTIYTILARGAVVGDEGWQGDSGFSFAWFFDLSYTERLLVGSLLLFFAALGLRILLFFPNRIYLSFHDKKKVRVKHPNRATGFLLDFRASFWDTGNSYWCLKNGLPHFYDVNGFPWLNVVLFLITIPFKGGGGGSFYGSRGGGRSGGGGAGGRF